MLEPQDILEWNFDLTDKFELRFDLLDRLMDKHSIDITGLSISSTARGNLFRTHRLMSAVSAAGP
jgi:hypothetical protein